MQILVDADACPVKNIIVTYARRAAISVMMFCDTAHSIEDGYSTVITVDKGKDSVDFVLLRYLQKGDILVTQDYGLAAMALAKGARALNQNGLIYSNSNIDQLLHDRYVGQKIRRAGGRTKGPPKRSTQDDQNFERALDSLRQKED